ncbi:hypothetical protein SM19410_15480 [Xanthomonas hortorum pv. gardneri]|nr:hypothetical protein SM17710_18600 [Xanthomonas hortorum pv. gardneri]KLA95445.1 hypothetical protein SM19410_15480 [Xanthomonas hortorum pv. gardneri]KLA98809.1 hypothetical protein SM18210_17245 [Xanthomonas hortorum pv. gardneri]KLB08244.1 hypothetical protein SM22010_15870 [Xanthomonas hortorum pv. gardneri]KLB13137.1 hypothetical protein SM23410_00585 [Xanthomonas hortorum pv. gardneri]
MVVCFAVLAAPGAWRVARADRALGSRTLTPTPLPAGEGLEALNSPRCQRAQRTWPLSLRERGWGEGTLRGRCSRPP